MTNDEVNIQKALGIEESYLRSVWATCQEMRRQEIKLRAQSGVAWIEAGKGTIVDPFRKKSSALAAAGHNLHQEGLRLFQNALEKVYNGNYSIVWEEWGCRVNDEMDFIND